MSAPETTDTNAVATLPQTPAEGAFALAQRQAQALAASSLVPNEYQGNVPNCMLALEFAQRTGSSVFQVMQNVYVIHGRPSVSSQFIIAALNSCGRFSPLRFRVEGEGMEMRCHAYAIDRDTGDELPGPPVSMEMAEAEGWLGKRGSKWATMPELMIRYRAAAFFGRLYAPDILMGMRTDDEMRDIAAAGSEHHREQRPAAEALANLRNVTPEPVTTAAEDAEASADTSRECDLCAGSGVDPDADEPCRGCGGQGRILF
jgi:hypothetical protein